MPKAMKINMMPACGNASSERISMTKPPKSVPKAMPKCSAALFKLCCTSAVFLAIVNKWLWIGGVMPQLTTPQTINTSQNKTSMPLVNGMKNRQSVKTMMLKNNVRFTPNRSALMPDNQLPKTAAAPNVKYMNETAMPSYPMTDFT